MKRRKFIQLIAASSIAGTAAVRAEKTQLTTPQTEGPYYPVVPITETNSLIETGYAGSELVLSGTVRNLAGNTLASARVEIWQCDANGVYQHPAAPNTAAFDPHFKGAASQLTDTAGRYQFTTIVPVPYGGRPPHIHTKIFINNTEKLTSQIYLSESGAADDLIIDPKGTSHNAYAATFDFIISS